MSDVLIRRLKTLYKIMDDIFTDHEEELRAVDVGYGHNLEIEYEDIMSQLELLTGAMES